MVLAAYGYVEERGSGSQSTSRPWPVTSSEWSGHGWTRCWSHRLPWRPLPPLHEATRAVASPLMPTRTGYGAPQRPHRPQHKPRPEQPNPSRLTALTPQNQPEKTLVTRESTLTISRLGGSLPAPTLGGTAMGRLGTKRLGLLTPAGNTTIEDDFARWMPDSVRLHVNRLYTGSASNPNTPGRVAVRAARDGR